MISDDQTVVISIDPHRITLEDAKKYDEVLLDAFSRDPLHHAFWGSNYTFRDRPVARKDLLRYNTLVTVDTWKLWGQLRDVNARVFAILSNNEPIGICIWDIPEILSTKPGRLHVLKSILIDLWLNILTIWFFGAVDRQPISWPRYLVQNSQAIDKEFGLVREDIEDYHRSLVHLSDSEMLDARYIRTDYMWLRAFGVKHSMQGLGFGKILLQQSIRELPKFAPIFVSGNKSKKGLLKYALFSTAEGMGLYAGAGFENKGEAYVKLSDSYITLTFMEHIGEFDFI